jgi:uncharacterized protein
LRAIAPWAAAAVACLAVGSLVTALGLPAPWLLAGLLGGLAVAVTRGRSLAVPGPVMLVAQAAVGVALGSEVAPGALAGVAGGWWIVLATVLLTLSLSVAVALLLARVTGLDRLTATTGTLPGAAPALIAAGDEIGADARIVATMQYGRVLLVVASVPVLALLLGAEPSPGGEERSGAGALGASAVLAAAAVATLGLGLAALARVPAASLVGPLALSGLATATGVVELHVPPPIADASFVAVGATVGLSFDRPSLRRVGRLAPALAGAALVLMAGCAGVGLALLVALDTDPLTAYLATTPGGISSVLAAAFSSGADLTLVVAVQTLRLLLLALVAPFAARTLRACSPAGPHRYSF